MVTALPAVILIFITAEVLYIVAEPPTTSNVIVADPLFFIKYNVSIFPAPTVGNDHVAGDEPV